ncbi:hypothetical protein DEFDS_0374 [Deferribacter desulfuricans SSM1]|uniref:N-acetyltransferase domain-containing protein n=2 Tax=Deferribacter TaxID=53572 RepID=D3PB95_DEFDS|nr:hypothetical protein DEFDS_0374 [Deferribacter desulfuricans SSM1]
MITYMLLTKIEDKYKIKGFFQEFFYKVYSKILDDSIWEHQFIHSPYDDSPLFLAFDDKKIVGSALMIKHKILLNNKIYNYYLFTTSAIDPNYRNKGVYLELLNMQKKYAKDTKKDFILAFPNKIAYNAIKILGGFKDVSQEKIVKTNINNINLNSFCNHIIEDKEFLRWRFEHKNYNFIKIDEKILVVKKYKDSFDILSSLYIDSINNDVIPSNKFININNLKSCHVLEKHTINKNLNQFINYYNATIYLINNKIDFNKNKMCINLLMSDVF